jgi:translation initiation factor IF-2
VVVLGLDDVPFAGDSFQVIPDGSKARQIVQYRQAKLREESLARTAARRSLERLHETIQAGEVVDLPIILKADVAGSVEALQKTLVDLSTDEVKVRIVHSATGAITEYDVLLAATTNSIVIGFNVRPERSAAEMAKKEGVDIRLHTVIYAVTEEMEQAMLGRLAPTLKEKYLGRAEVRQTFGVPKVGTVAGCYVSDGVVTRDAQIRLLRDNVVIHEGKVASLKRFKDDAREVKSGFECGIGLERYQDIKIDDVIEFFVIEEIARSSLEPTEKATGS